MNKILVATLLIPLFTLGPTISAEGKSITQKELSSLIDEISPVYLSNGFYCEKAGASFNESLTEVICRLDIDKFNGDSSDKEILKGFTATSVSLFPMNLTQSVGVHTVIYMPFSGCLFINNYKDNSFVVYSKEEKRFELKGKLTNFVNAELNNVNPSDFGGHSFGNICPLVSERLEYHPEGYLKLKK